MVFFQPNRVELCLKCGQCMAVCPTKSVDLGFMAYDKEIYELTKDEVSWEQFYNLLGGRRSIRNFQDKPVPRELIQKILDAMALAPFGAIPDSVNITVVQDRKIIEQALPAVAEFYTQIGQWFKNPFIRMMMRRKMGIENFTTVRQHLLPRIYRGHYDVKTGKDHITRNAPALIILHARPDSECHTHDGIILITYGILAAHALGLGATVIELIPPAINKNEKVRKILQIPEDHEAICSMIVGYPKYHFHRGIKREKTKVKWL